jgi:hypothetical protein
MMKRIAVMFVLLPALSLAQEKDCSGRNKFRYAVCTASEIDAANKREMGEAEESAENAKAAARRRALATKAAEKAQLEKEIAEAQQQLDKVTAANDAHSKMVLEQRLKVLRAIQDKSVVIGMRREEAKRAWGKPDQINRTTTLEHVTEQWCYGIRNYLYFTDGVLTSIQN